MTAFRSCLAGRTLLPAAFLAWLVTAGCGNVPNFLVGCGDRDPQKTPTEPIDDEPPAPPPSLTVSYVETERREGVLEVEIGLESGSRFEWPGMSEVVWSAGDCTPGRGG